MPIPICCWPEKIKAGILCRDRIFCTLAEARVFFCKKITATAGKRGFVAFCMGNVFKYLWRHEAKNGQEDVDKAGTYLMQLNDMKKHGELVKSDERKLESLMELHRKESEKYAQS